MVANTVSASIFRTGWRVRGRWFCTAGRAVCQPGKVALNVKSVYTKYAKEVIVGPLQTWIPAVRFGISSLSISDEILIHFLYFDTFMACFAQRRVIFLPFRGGIFYEN